MIEHDDSGRCERQQTDSPSAKTSTSTAYDGLQVPVSGTGLRVSHRSASSGVDVTRSVDADPGLHRNRHRILVLVDDVLGVKLQTK